MARITRGVTKVQATTAVKFTESDAEANNLFLGELVSVEVTMATASEKNRAFNGMQIPRLVYKFGSKHSGAEQRFAYKNELPVESTPDTISGGKDAWRVDNILKFMAHIYEVFALKGREWTPEEEKLLAFNLEDTDEDGRFVSLPPDIVVDAYTELFTNFANLMNGAIGLKEGETPKPVYKTANGNGVRIWMKLLRYTKRKNQWTAVNDGALGIPAFIGSGVIELVDGNNPPKLLKFDSSMESIIPQKTEQTTNPTMGNPNTMGIPSSMNMAAAAAAASAGSPWN